MAYTTTTGDRIDELRFRNAQQTSRNEAAMMGLVSPPRTNGNATRLPPPINMSNDGRASLTRRFTTDSGRVPTMNTLSSQRSSAEVQEYAPSTYHKVQLLEKKKLEFERLREQKRRFEAEMQLLDLQQRRDAQELAQMEEDLTRGNGNGAPNGGHQSEPTTPPEYRDSHLGFPSAFSRPNRYSTSSLTSPIGLYSRPGRSGSQLTSPQGGINPQRYTMDDNKLPSKSVPGSRRNSDEDEKEEAVRQDPTSHRSTNATNRYSMPVTKSRTGMNEMLSLDQTNTTRFLFGDEEPVESVDQKNYLQMTTADNFPVLVRGRESTSGSAALDLASSSASDSDGNGWSAFSRNRLSNSHIGTNGTGTPNGKVPSSNAETPNTNYRRSLDMKHYLDSQQESPAPLSIKHTQVTPPRLQSSYSANDVPTMKTASVHAATANGAPNSHAQQHFHNHNASLGRIPPNALNNRLSRDLSLESPTRESPNGHFQSISSALHANAPAFGPVSQNPAQGQGQGLGQGQIQPQSPNGVGLPTMPNYNGSQPYYNGYNMQILQSGMQNMQMGQPTYSPHNPYAYNNMYPQNGQVGGMRDSQARVIQQRRQTDGEAMNKFANLPLESLGGEIYALCKDQHGCRYLQKKLEERNPEHVHMIWLETNQHVVELMTDPFGNYLCQKLLEYSNDEERTVLIENASRDLVRIALNQHGTRALQKMIEFISTPGQIQTIIEALRFQVVDLIQDLNGNHVIQKCLNKLSPADAQFIFDAVGHHCIDVGTHRHGCCVLQRCIDHASGEQKDWLIRQISNNAYTLVQDPFGNYVVQYILDLNETNYTEPLVAMFQGRVCQLSRQKFSSNVMEKCLRCAQEVSKDMIIEELIQPTEIDKLLRDSYANYVIQTALDYASPATKARLIEAIRPLLTAIRSTPYGRRIQAKITGPENRSGPSSGQATPSEANNGQIPLRQTPTHQRTISSASVTSFAANQYGGSNFGQGTHTPNAPYQASQLVGNGVANVGSQQQVYGASYPRGPVAPPPGNYF